MDGCQHRASQVAAHAKTPALRGVASGPEPGSAGLLVLGLVLRLLVLRLLLILGLLLLLVLLRDLTHEDFHAAVHGTAAGRVVGSHGLVRATAFGGDASARRSEEHTSELQSPCNLVCRLLLEKKRKLTK